MPKLPTLPYSLLWALPNVCLQILPQILPSSTSGRACFLPSRGQNLPDLPPGSSTSGRACFLPSRNQHLPFLAHQEFQEKTNRKICPLTEIHMSQICFACCCFWNSGGHLRFGSAQQKGIPHSRNCARTKHTFITSRPQFHYRRQMVNVKHHLARDEIRRYPAHPGVHDEARLGEPAPVS